MAQDIFVLHDPEIANFATVIAEKTYINGTFESSNFELTEDVLVRMAQRCATECFFLIVPGRDIDYDKFDFSFKPPEWHIPYMHIWNGDPTIRLFNKSSVLQSPKDFTDAHLASGEIYLIDIDADIYEHPIYDIVFMSYDEYDIEEKFKKLSQRFPRAMHSHGVKGIKEAHLAAGKMATTERVYIVDADAEIVPAFNFNYVPEQYDKGSVHIWHSRNPINDLEYGYGGVKLFPTWALLGYTGKPVDFTTSVVKNIRVIPEVSNVTRFNTDPFSTWRSAFRECVKLSTTMKYNMDSEYRLHEWCTKGEDREFGDFALLGAKEGKDFGLKNIDQPELLKLINDFNWLEQRFNS